MSGFRFLSDIEIPLKVIPDFFKSDLRDVITVLRISALHLLLTLECLN